MDGLGLPFTQLTFSSLFQAPELSYLLKNLNPSFGLNTLRWDG